MLRSIVRLATSAAREEAAVVIPVYRSLVTPEEKISYDRVLTVFKKKPIVLIAPAGLNTAEFARGHERLRVERFDRAWFQSHRGYSRLLLTPGFYERFLPYEYILICQTDAFVFADCLSGWCGRGYDYIGAPWVGLEKEMAQQARDRVLIRRIWPWLHERTNAREVKILMRLPDGRNVVTRQAVHGSAPCARTEVTGRWLGTAADSPCLDDSSRGDSRRRTP